MDCRKRKHRLLAFFMALAMVSVSSNAMAISTVTAYAEEYVPEISDVPEMAGTPETAEVPNAPEMLDTQEIHFK